MEEDGTGYLQHDFVIRCPQYDCTYVKITKEVLALRKLTEDLVRQVPLTQSFLAFVQFFFRFS
jgi:hypothetical protein